MDLATGAKVGTQQREKTVELCRPLFGYMPSVGNDPARFWGSAARCLPYSWRRAWAKAGALSKGCGRVGLSRRGMIHAALAAGAVAATGRTWASEPMGQKVSQAEARYQDRPKGGFSCAACALFRPPHACVVVAGDISPDGWCRFFDLPD